MISRKRIAVAWKSTIILLAMAGAFAWQVASARAADLPVETRTSANPDSKAIQAALGKAVQQLLSAAPAEQKKGREEIIDEVGPAGAGTPSAAFFYEYAKDLNDALKVVLSAPEMRSRLNGAIATARVAEKAGPSGATQLMPSVLAFMNDQSEAVALWGVKGAKPVLAVLSSQGRIDVPPLLASIGATGAKFPSTTAAAYWAFTVTPADSKASPVDPKAMTLIIDATQKLLEARTALWATSIPAEPTAENLACSMLTDSRIWNANTAAQKTRTLAALKKLADAVGQQIVVGTVANDQKESVAILVRTIASSIGSIGINDSNATLTKEVEPIIKGVSVSAHPTPQQIADACKQIDDTLTKQFPALGSAPTTAPAAK